MMFIMKSMEIPYRQHFSNPLRGVRLPKTPQSTYIIYLEMKMLSVKGVVPIVANS